MMTTLGVTRPVRMRAGGFDEDPGKPFAVETLGFVAGMTTMIGIDQLVHLYMIREPVPITKPYTYELHTSLKHVKFPGGKRLRTQ